MWAVFCTDMQRFYSDEPEFQEGDIDDPLNEGEAGDDVDHYGDDQVVHSSAGGAVPPHRGGAGKPNEERITTPYMTKYEKARILGTRALQIRYVGPGYSRASANTCQYECTCAGPYRG